MKKFMLLCLSIFVLGGTFPAYAQFHGDFFVGDNFAQSGVAIASRPVANPIIVGTTNPNGQPFRLRGMVYTDNDATGNISGIKYDFGANNLRFTSAANSSSNTLVGAAGSCRVMGSTTDEAFFADVSGNIADDAQQMVVFVNPGSDRATKVIELQDNSFVVVGSNLNGTIGTSWVARIGSRPSYDVKFYRTIGDPNGPASGGETANAVAQAIDGSILVAGTTFQNSTSAQGSIYIARLTSTGALSEYHTYTIGGGVLAPRVQDMGVLNDGSLVLVGNTNIPNDADHFGFIMQVSSNLATASFQEVIQPGVNTFGQELNAITVIRRTNHYYVAGMVQRLLSGAINEDGLLIKVEPSIGPTVVKANDINNGTEAYFDVVIRKDSVTVEAVGVADALPSGVTGPTNSNVFSHRTNLNLDACAERPVSLEFDSRPVTHATPVTVSSQSTLGRNATFTLSGLSLQSVLGCQSPARLGSDPHEGDVTPSAQLDTDPIRQVASLHLGKHATEAQVTLSDMRGHLLRQWAMVGPNLDIALDGLEAGLYMVSVSNGTHQSTLKLTVQ